MKQLGIDLGTSTVKIVLWNGEGIDELWISAHYGKVAETLRTGLHEVDLPEKFAVCVTGGNRKAVLSLCPQLAEIEDIPAIVEGVKKLVPDAGSIIEIGSQSARFITELGHKTPRFSVNEHCAGGTGSFFEDQTSRLGLKIEDYSLLTEQAGEIPNISGRCAVFAKTDIIHRQQEGVSKQDILLGLCYAMVRNYKAVIVRGLPVEKPVAFCGGVTSNSGVVRAIRDIFSLERDELIIPENARFASALGAAVCAEKPIERNSLLRSLLSEDVNSVQGTELPRLRLMDGTDLSEPSCISQAWKEGVYFGVDIGSTSMDFVVMGQDGSLIDFLYLRTAGDPEGAVRRGFAEMSRKYGDVKILSVGVTGSGRERIGRMMGADVIRDEITAQAKAAAYWVPDADTVFEIGGQDSKYISLKEGEVADFQMNKICAAGTGSFVEEQASRMGIPIEEFGSLALAGEHPRDLGERCTVFIETSIAQAAAQGARQTDIAAGLCHSIVKNYLNRVVSGKPVGNRVVLQGGVVYNAGIVAAFQSVYGDKIHISPVFSISGAFGTALLAKEAAEASCQKRSSFFGFDFPKEERRIQTTDEEIRRNKAFYRKAGQLAAGDYDGVIDPKKKTVGVPLTLIMFKFFPMVNAFFKHLGFNVILSHPTDEETIRLSQKYAQGETCYPVKLIYGHMMQLAEQKVDYIFLPSILTIRHPHAHAAHNYACPYMQTAAKAVFDTLRLEQRGIRLLSPTLNLDLGARMMALAMLDTGKSLGFRKSQCLPGLLKGAAAVQKYTAGVEKLGEELMANLKPEEKVLVLITRNYGISDPMLNMGIPDLLLQRGYKVMTLGHLPGMSLDISKDYPGMYWPFGDHLLSGAKLIANHPNLYAVYLTNHGCGPDTLISHMFQEEMGDKPYLQIEVDEHYSKVGVITRVEAFLNSISNRPPAKLPENFNILNVSMKPANISRQPDKEKKLFLPDLGWYTRYLKDYFCRQGFDAREMPAFSREVLAMGRAEMHSKEYLPLPVLVGGCLKVIEENGDDKDIQFLIPYGYGADADGQYARAVRTILDRRGYTKCGIAAPMLEELSESASDPELLMRALLTGDAVYALHASEREKLAPLEIPTEEELLHFAGLVNASYAEKKRLNSAALSNMKKIKNEKMEGSWRCEAGSSEKTVAVVGSPMCITGLDEGILSVLEEDGYTVRRMPLSEMMWFLWKENGKLCDRRQIDRFTASLGEAGGFSPNADTLFESADKYLGVFAGNHGRYRYAKAVEFGRSSDAVLTLAPRYENTAMVLQLRGIVQNCEAPLFEVSLDGDWDENSWSRLRSFLYYC